MALPAVLPRLYCTIMQVAVKVMRHAGSSVDGRSQVDPEQHCTLLMRLTTISHPNLVNVSMLIECGCLCFTAFVLLVLPYLRAATWHR